MADNLEPGTSRLLIRELLGRPVISVQEGSNLGGVSGVVFDPTSRRVVYLRVGGGLLRAGKLAPFGAIRSIGPHAVTLESAAAMVEQLNQSERASYTEHLGDRPVVSESGSRMGHVTDYQLDTTTGQVMRFCVKADPGTFLQGLIGGGQVGEIPAEQVTSIGHDAIVVADGAPVGSTESLVDDEEVVDSSLGRAV